MLDDILEAEYKEYEKYMQLQKLLYHDAPAEKFQQRNTSKNLADPDTMMSAQEVAGDNGNEKEEDIVEPKKNEDIIIPNENDVKE